MATKIERILAPARGLNTFDGPSAIPKDAAPELVNFLPGAAGKIFARNGFEPPYYLNANIGSSYGINVDELVVEFGTSLVVGNGTAPKLLTAPHGAGDATGLGTRTFLQRYGSAQVDDVLFAVDSNVSPRIINSITSGGTVAAFSSNAPRNPIFIFSYFDSLWVFGGRDTPASSTADETSVLFYVNPGTTPADSAAAWQTNGITNRITVGTPGDGEDAVAAVPFRRTLLLLKTGSAYQMIGTEPANFEIRLVSPVLGCNSANTVCVTERAVYWASEEGIVAWDGTSTIVIGRSIADQIPYDAVRYISRFDSTRILLASDTTTGKSFLYDELTGTFTEYSASVVPHDLSVSAEAEVEGALRTVRPIRAIDFSTSRVFLSGPSISQKFFFFTSLSEAGAIPRFDAALYDAGFMAPTIVDARTPECAIRLYWKSRMIRPTSPLNKARLVKLYVDYRAPTVTLDENGSWSATTDSNAPDLFYARVVGENGTEILAETALPSQGSASTGRRRHIIELTGVEAAEYYVEIYTKEGTNDGESSSYTDPLVIPVDVPEVHDVWVEYEEAQRRVAV